MMKRMPTGIGLQETKAQRWSAVAILKNGQEALICLGASSVDVRNIYAIPWFELFTEEVRREVTNIEMQKWMGAPDYGRWIPSGTLPIPTKPAVQVA
jgi:hypothetical protein